ncbi:di-heme oxidoreductase family protein [Pseudomonas auratipiscis]|uniref:Di-heme oxidoredictase family protein n=1 Tax=Pseudomonas auratipiscis TaxID=3115853 RepID=A0AB35WMK9_9PSED|nr:MULTISPECIES: di-heme oxidoredictase family protein [unclassified Pseudomonas]MEE1865810.1 di-heme oxidoredictase family protein [Pseudomonas sp. 120P]MEE1957021.1 di-heme oxidoredictase family protein [Pseudomonas sp. 119P]
MNALRAAGLLIGLLVSGLASADVTHTAANREAYAQPFAKLDDNQLERFFRGRSLFRQAWVVAPSRDAAVDGLGPLYNRVSCIACHPKNGRGQAPRQGEAMRSMLLRLSVPGHDAHGGPKPHLVYGDQLNELAVPGVPGEGRAHVHWQEHALALGDGETVMLRTPRVQLRELAYGPLDGVMTSARVGSPVFGLGLLEAIDEATLHAMAAEAKPDGVSGRVNQVWSVERQRAEAGRFGLKANQPDLRQQIAHAMLGDLGITSTLAPVQNCTPAQQDCARAPHGGEPELDAMQLGDLHFYLAHLAVPARRQQADPTVIEGEKLFAALGCSACHRPALITGKHPLYPALTEQRIAPYTDLLLHDMGAGLADGREDYLANGRQWRTPALWGLGLGERINPGSGYLHDGRARTLEEAIVWHGGEAEIARQRYVALAAKERRAIRAFLESL